MWHVYSVACTCGDYFWLAVCLLVVVKYGIILKENNLTSTQSFAGSNKVFKHHQGGFYMI